MVPTWCVLLAAVVVMSVGAVANALSFDQLIQQAKNEIRAAESAMQNGVHDESAKGVQAAAETLVKARAIDAANYKVGMQIGRVEGIRKTLETRTGKKIPLATDPGGSSAADAMPTDAEGLAPISVIAGTAAPTTQAAAAPPGKLPYHTRNIVTFAGQELGGAERYFRDLESGTDGLDENTRLRRIEMSLQAVEEMLPGLAEQAASDGVSNDPRVISVSKELAEMKAKLAEMKSGAAGRQAAAAELQAGADGDVAALRKLFDRLNTAYFTKAKGKPIYFNTIDEPVALLGLIRKFEAEEQAKAQKAVDAFAKKYGNAVNELTGNQMASYPFDGIRNGIANIAKTRDVMATKLAQRSQDTIESLPSLHDLYRVKNHDDARAWFRLAKTFTESNAAVKALDKTIEKQLRADLEAYAKKVEDKTWPGNSKGKEAKAGITFFENAPGWGSPQKSERTKGNEPLETLGIHIRGDWSVQARNREGDPTMYGIPAFVAVQSKTDKEMGLARVYSITLRTRESRDPEMKPPFISILVGDSYYIQAKKVK